MTTGLIFRICLVSAIALPLAGASKGLMNPQRPDPTFNAPRFITPSPASGTLLLPDGGFLRFFNTHTLIEQPTGAVTRHFADGSLDPSFRFSSNYHFVGGGLQLPNGQLILAAARRAYDGERIEELLRVNPDGSLDTTFPPVLVMKDTGGGNARGFVLQPDGKLLVTGGFTTFNNQARPGIVRLHGDGMLDTSFAAVPLAVSNLQIGSLAANHPILQPDGKIVIFGNFNRIGNASFPAGVARLNADGSLDSSFVPSGFTRSTTVRVGLLQSDGKIIIGGRFSRGGYSNYPFLRLNGDGTVDPTYGYLNTAAATFIIRDAVLQPDGKVVGTSIAAPVASVFRFDANGVLDTAFRQPAFQYRYQSPDLFPQPVRIARQADGRLLVSGVFTDVDSASPGLSHFGVARFLGDGTLDPSLTTNTRTGVVTWPQQAFTHSSGKTSVSFRPNDISAAGEAPVPNNYSRLNADGTIDATYNPFANPDPQAPLQSDFMATGFAPLAGDQTFVFGSKGPYGEFDCGRLLGDGSQDLTFAVAPAVMALFNSTAQALVQPNFGILLTIRDAANPPDSAQATLNDLMLRRLTFNGGLDASCRLPASITASIIVRADNNNLPYRVYSDSRVVAVQPDGKILFAYLDSETSGRLVRLNPDGSFDGSFSPVQLQPLATFITFPQLYDPQTNVTLQPANGVVSGELVSECDVQRDGRLVVTGSFKSVNGTPSRGIARVNANGGVDSSFGVGTGPGWTTLAETETVRPIIEQVEPDAGGKLLITGTFEAFNGVPAPGIARLNPDGSVDSTFVAPAIRNRFYSGGSLLTAHPDGSFLLSGPYSTPDDELRRPSLLRILGAPVLTAAASRKVHGSAGSFDIYLPLSGVVGVESRNGGAVGNYTLVFTFNNPLASGSANVISGSGTVAGTPTFSGKTMTVELTGVTNAQRTTVILQGVTDVASQVASDTAVNVGFLIGDANGDGTVNSGDALQTRSRSGQATDATNFRSDVNADGVVNGGDVIVVRNRSGNSLP